MGDESGDLASSLSSSTSSKTNETKESQNDHPSTATTAELLERQSTEFGNARELELALNLSKNAAEGATQKTTATKTRDFFNAFKETTFQTKVLSMNDELICCSEYS